MLNANDIVPLTEPEIQCIELSLPWCILNPDQPLWEPEEIGESLQQTIDSLIEKGVFQPHLLSYAKSRPAGKIKKARDKKQTERLVLTATGKKSYLASRKPGEFLFFLDPTNLNLTFCTGKNAEWKAQMIQNSDLQGFLHAAGVWSPYDATLHHISPFPFGIPQAFLQTKPRRTFHDELRFCLALESARASGDYMKTDIPPLSVPNLFNAKNEVFYNIKLFGEKITQINNSRGVVVDFQKRLLYFAIYNLDYTNFRWQHKALANARNRIDSELRAWEITNIAPTSKELKDIFVFYNGEQDFRRLLSMFRKMDGPFWNILPIPMTRDGAKMLHDILELGVDEWRKQSAIRITHKLPDARITSPETMYPISQKNIQLYDGTYFDFKGMYSLARTFKLYRGRPVPLGRVPYVVCYHSQRKIYTTRVRVPKQCIIEIPED